MDLQNSFNCSGGSIEEGRDGLLSIDVYEQIMKDLGETPYYQNEEYKNFNLEEFLKSSDNDQDSNKLEPNFVIGVNNDLMSQREYSIYDDYARLSDFLPNLPESARAFVLPPGFEIKVGNITWFTNCKNPALVSYQPLFIIKKVSNIDTEDEMLQLTFLKDEAWKNITLSREEVLSQSRLQKYSSKGLPVNSGNSRILVHFLASFEAINEPLLPRAYSYSSFGWKSIKDKQCFALGNKLIGADVDAEFTPIAAGEKQYSEAIIVKGSIENWKAGIKKLTSFKKVMFVFYAAFVPPLLQILGLQNFIIHLFGESSIGKTTLLRIAASIWGKPMQGELILPWSSTNTAIEMAVSLFNCMVLFLDDSQTNRSKKNVSDAIYFLANSSGKGRGDKRGSQKLAKFKSVILSTGEGRITETTEWDGAKTRTIELHDPFDGQNTDVIRNLEKVLEENYGHGSEVFINELCQIINNPDKKETLKQYYQNKRDKFISSEKGKANVLNRMSQYFAAIELTGEIVEELFGFGADPADVVKSVFDETALITDETDLASRAYESIIAWAYTNQSKFDSVQNNYYTNASDSEVYGVIRKDTYIAVIPDALKTFLESKGYPVDAVFQSFKTKNIIQLDGSHSTCKVSFRGNKIRMHKFPIPNTI